MSLESYAPSFRPPRPPVRRSLPQRRGHRLRRSDLVLASSLAFWASRPRRAEAQDAPLLEEQFSCGGLDLKNPRLLGGGVQGEVYQATLDSSRVAVKISRQNSDYAKRTFERERRVVDLLKEAKVPYVERCLAGGPVKTLQGERQGLVMMPCLPEGRVISVKTGSGSPRMFEWAEDRRMEKLMKTAVRVLEAGVAGVDVQVLQVLGSNEQTWIDFTEAALLGGQKGKFTVEGPQTICPEYKNRYRSAKDAVVGFATEVYLLVPPSSRQLAAEALVEELQELSKVQSRGLGKTFQDVWSKLPWRCDSITQRRLDAASDRAAGMLV